MTQRKLLVPNPDTQALLDLVALRAMPSFVELTPDEARVAYEQRLRATDIPSEPLPHVRDLELPGAGGPLLARLYSARALPAPAQPITAGLDPLRDEGAAYAARLAQAGVPTTYHCVEGTVHGFLGMGRILQAGRDALDSSQRGSGWWVITDGSPRRVDNWRESLNTNLELDAAGVE